MRVSLPRLVPLLLLVMLPACQRDTALSGPPSCEYLELQDWLAASELEAWSIGVASETVNVHLPESETSLSTSLRTSLEAACGEQVVVILGGVPRPVDG